jgi:coniferyl-aldehyde dehydrogenase
MAESTGEAPGTAAPVPPELQAIFDRLRAAASDGSPGYRERLATLDALLAGIRARIPDIAAAANADYGGRSRHETLIAEVYLTVSNIKYTRRRLKRWMRPQRRPVSWPFKPARARVLCQPLGVVGILAPWNYPFYLAMMPLIAALAAGNRALLKPSEVTPRTAQLLGELIAESLDPDVAAVVHGGPEVGAACCRLPFDHLFFTGSTQVGRSVLRAASEHLTPATLELGGKSPAILSDRFPLRTFVERLAAGKLFNAGQTCVAPDYVLAPAGVVSSLIAELQRAVAEFYPSIADNPDYTAVVNQRHYDRLRGYVEDAARRGARLVELHPEAGAEAGASSAARRKFPPTLVLDPSDDMLVMQEEIFGPILPVRPYETLDEAIAYVNARPHPLALYYFDTDRRRIRRVLERTLSGTVCVNDTVIQTAQDALPFGGVGASGMGTYHGREGFETFSHRRAVLYQSRLQLFGAVRPPYGRRAGRIIRLMLGREGAAAFDAGPPREG